MKKDLQEREESKDSMMMSPSFSSYTSDKLADIADRVNQDYFRSIDPRDNNNNNNGFEFVTFQKVSDGVFLDGPVFPVFNRDLLTLYESDGGDDHAVDLQFPMRNLTVHDENDRPSSSSSSSSSSVDELEEIPQGSYCVWTPNSPKSSPIRQKKSNSTGSRSSAPSKRWKLLDLLRRSNSDGKDSTVLVTPTSSGPNLEKKKLREKKVVSAHEAFYARKKEMSEQNKRKSYLPYRQDLIGFGVGGNGVCRALRSF